MHDLAPKDYLGSFRVRQTKIANIAPRHVLQADQMTLADGEPWTGRLLSAISYYTVSRISAVNAGLQHILSSRALTTVRTGMRALH